MLIVAGIIAIISIVLVFAGKAWGKKALYMASIDTSLTKEITDLAQDVAKEIGPGSFNRLVELKGVVECDQSLKAEMSGEACVWYRSVVTREYEETYTERDSDGNSRTSTRRGSETVSSNERSTIFNLRDATGVIAVDPQKASIDPVKAMSKFEKGELTSGFSIGSFKFSFNQPGHGRRTIGYKIEEFILPLGKELYVLGEARDEGNRLLVSKPSDKSSKFIISVKRKEELIKNAQGSQKGFSIAAVVLGIGAVILAVFGVLR